MRRTNSSRPHMEELTMIAGQAPVQPKRRLLQVKGIKKNDCRREWVETLGIGKEMMHIMAIVRSLRLNFRCFGSVPAPSEEEEEDAELENVKDYHCKGSDAGIESNIDGKNEESRMVNESEDQESHVSSLSPDAHVIKRCVSAPAKGWQSRRDDRENRVLGAHKLQRGSQEQTERLIFKSYAPDFFRVSPDITNKAWNKKSAFGLLHRSHSLMR